MCADNGLGVADVAKLLHVTTRTVRYWFSGKTAVPYSAYKLVRIMARYELPAPAWKGWLFHSGKLWTPEGHGFMPNDCAWWALTVRKAAQFHVLYQENTKLKAAQRAAMGDANARPERHAVPLDLSLEHFGKTGINRPALVGFEIPNLGVPPGGLCKASNPDRSGAVARGLPTGPTFQLGAWSIRRVQGGKS